MSSGDLSINAFICELAKPVYAPGGGAAACVCAALSSSLLSMAASITADNPRYNAFHDELASASDELRGLNLRLIALIDRDADAFEPLLEVYKLPKDTEGYQQKRQTAVLYACSVPEEILHCTSEICRILSAVADKCSSSILPDVCCSAYLSAAAAKCAAVTIFSNTNMIKGTHEADRIENETRRIVAEISAITDRVLSFVTDKYTPEVR